MSNSASLLTPSQTPPRDDPPMESYFQPLFETIALESPFAWQTESFLLTRLIIFFPDGMNPTISFYSTRKSKILGYVPILGTIIGVNRIFEGFKEHALFSNSHLHSLSHRSLLWITRGLIECIPILGGIICIITDIVATRVYSNHPTHLSLPDETPCGFCHTCELCQC